LVRATAPRRLKAARLGGKTFAALETARLLAKHRAFSAAAGTSIVRGLTLELIRATHDSAQMERVWATLDATERVSPDITIGAAKQLLKLGGDVSLSRTWLVPIWEQMLLDSGALAPTLSLDQRINLIETLEQGFALAQGAPDAAWLTRIEGAQVNNPGDASLQYLAGVTCLHLKLWGKAHQLLTQSAVKLRGSKLERNTWLSLAILAEQRDDSAAALDAYKKALSSGTSGH
jgi:HemY protein